MSRRRRDIITQDDICTGTGRYVDIEQYQLYQYLQQEGFFIREGFIYKIDDYVAHIVTKQDLIEFIYDNVFKIRNKKGKVVATFPEHREFFTRRVSNFISDSKLNLLGSLRGELLRDDKENCYIPFLNGIVHITREVVELLPFGDVLTSDKILLEEKVIKKDIEIMDRVIPSQCDFFDFCIKAIDGKGLTAKMSETNGVRCLMKAIGYLIHQYKDPSKAKMIFFSDCNNARGVANGRTGKSLIAKVALSQVRNIAVVDGKQFAYNDKFMLDNVSTSTDIVCLQDMRSDFNKESMYNMITGDFQIGKKYRPKEIIPFYKAPKMIADSNFSVSLNGASDFARFCVIGFSHYWNKNHQPTDEYKKRFFEDWTQREWNNFYSFMFRCVQLSMKENLQNYKLDDILKYSIYNKYPEELVNDVKTILSDEINILLSPIRACDLFEHIPYFMSDKTSSHGEKLALLKSVMSDLGYDYFTKVKALHNIERPDGTIMDCTSVSVIWFEKRK